jgi:hypothetical protein
MRVRVCYSVGGQASNVEFELIGELADLLESVANATATGGLLNISDPDGSHVVSIPGRRVEAVLTFP